MIHREVATFVIGKIRPLPQRELQRLGGLRRSWPGTSSAGADASRPGLISSFLSLVDIDKQADTDSMPFQPLLSPLRRPADPAAAPSPSAPPAAAGRGDGDWGELLGWWRDEAGVETFEVPRPPRPVLAKGTKPRFKPPTAEGGHV